MTKFEQWLSTQPLYYRLQKSFANKAYQAGRKQERAEIWEEVDSMIVRGKIGGHGLDPMAERSGLQKVANKIVNRNYKKH